MKETKFVPLPASIPPDLTALRELKRDSCEHFFNSMIVGNSSAMVTKQSFNEAFRNEDAFAHFLSALPDWR